MRVKDVIDELQRLDPELEVYVEQGSRYLDLVQKVDSLSNKDPYFAVVPGTDVCVLSVLP